jgi:ABC-type multidrug transport system fused ATPase/permease subunit
MNALQITRQALKGASTTKTVVTNPFGFALDNLIRIIVQALIPVPFASELVIYFKGPILAMIAGTILFFLTLLFIIITTLYSPFSTINSLANIVTGGITGQNLQQVIKSLNGYTEEGFSDTDIPNKNPFGGEGMDNTTITVNYHEIESFAFYGSQITETEQGIDIIPSAMYYGTNKAYKLTGLPIIFATVTGTTRTYVDGYGANTVEITNQKQSVKTIYIHLSQILVGNGVTVHPGQPIGVMGSTGMSTGPHLEYQVRLNQNGNWVTQDPTNYIN